VLPVRWPVKQRRDVCVPPQSGQRRTVESQSSLAPDCASPLPRHSPRCRIAYDNLEAAIMRFQHGGGRSVGEMVCISALGSQVSW
jgi:hypothetical protein